MSDYTFLVDDGNKCEEHIVAGLAYLGAVRSIKAKMFDKINTGDVERIYSIKLIKIDDIPLDICSNGE